MIYCYTLFLKQIMFSFHPLHLRILSGLKQENGVQTNIFSHKKPRDARAVLSLHLSKILFPHENKSHSGVVEL